jgi:hypothetical protein
MPKTKHSVKPENDLMAANAEQPRADPWPDFYNELIEHFWQDALRAAFTSNGALKKCRRRSCNLAGSCQMIHTPGKPVDCGGDEPEAAVEKAAFGLFCGCEIVAAFLPNYAKGG